MIVNSVIAILGLISLFAGSELLLRSTLTIANRLKLPVIFISIVIIGFGTNLPEIAASYTAALQHKPNLALGNVVGSNIANVLMAIGLAALLKPIKKYGANKIDALFMVLSNALFVLLILCHLLYWYVGLMLIVLLIAYLYFSYKHGKPHETTEATKLNQQPMIMTSIIAVIGLVLLIVGSDYFIRSIIAIAQYVGLSDTAIGLTIVAFATSLPETIAVILACYKNQTDMAIGTILGSNIFNALALTGGVLLLTHASTSLHLLLQSALVMLVVNSIFSALLYFRLPINRVIGFFMMLLYIAYIIYMF